MSLTPASPAVLSSSAMASPGDPRPKDAAQAAKQFEALLIAQMLRTAHESASGSLDEDSSSSSDTMFDVAGQQFAQILANNGGLGLARTVLQGIEPK